MASLKEIMSAVAKRAPEEDVGTGNLVDKAEVNDSLVEIRQKTKLIDRLGRYNRPQDMINDFSLDAVKRVIVEMEHGKSSSDRIKAAELILNHSVGKPIERVANVSMEVSQESDNEVNSKIKDLLVAFGITPNPNSFKASDPSAAVFMDVRPTTEII